MELTGNDLYRHTTRILMATISPIQGLVTKDCVTHSFCNRNAVEILYNDGKKFLARQADKYIEHINKGSDWADKGCKSLYHFFLPQGKKGLGRFSSAAVECQYYFNKALRKRLKGDYEKAFFYLGAATHLVQDLCVPHHARGVLFDGHQEYENWAEAHRAKYNISNKGIYNIGEKVTDWIEYNASQANELYRMVTKDSGEDDFDIATSVLLPQAQRTTAGFIALFLEQVKS